MNSRKRTSAYGDNVHTLAQVGTKQSSTIPKGSTIINGKGSDLRDIKTIRARAKRKQISQVLALELIKIAQENKNRPLEIKFRNTFYCLDKVTTVDGRIHGKYCKNRVCTVCLAIRKAEIINKYLPIVSQWSEPHFLTLTAKSIKKRSLHAVIINMKNELRKIIHTHNKRHRRGKGEKLMGLISMESNFCPIKKTYNPHFHIITNNRNTGEILLKEWLNRAKPKKVDIAGQKLVRVYNNLSTLNEIIKYGSKILTENDLDKNKKSGKNRKVYIRALYTIIEAFEGVRVFDHFGFKGIGNSQKESIPAKIAVEYKEFIYDASKTDWIESISQEKLTGFIPDDYIQNILENCLDTESS